MSHARLNSPNPQPRPTGRRPGTFLASAMLAVLLTGCAGSSGVPQPAWLPDKAGWTVRDADGGEPSTWVAYDRKAPGADVKEIRVVGLVDATPEVTMRALRYRLLAEEYIPQGLELEILHASEAEVVTYGVASMPWPFRDRALTERMRFTHEASTGVFRVDVDGIPTGEEVPRGTMQVPLVRNRMVVAPAEDGGSVLLADSVHDMGGAFPNRMIYGPVRKGMVDMLHDVRTLAAAEKPQARIAARPAPDSRNP